MSKINLLKKVLRPSTIAFWRAAQTRPGGSFVETVHGLFYLKWPELYIGLGLGRNRLSKFLLTPAYKLGTLLGLWSNDSTGASFADTYHGKVMPLQEARRFIRVDRQLDTVLPETVLPYKLARDIILENPADLALLNCPCRSTSHNPCLPLDVCIIAGKIIVDFVVDHHPEKSRRVSVDEAVEVVEASQKRGNVSHAFFKEAVLGRYYAICNCCSCCCGALQVHRQGIPMLASSGYVAKVYAELCIGCGKCAKACVFMAINMERVKENSETRPVISDALCLGCGICTLQCPKGAIKLVRDSLKPAPLIL